MGNVHATTPLADEQRWRCQVCGRELAYSQPISLELSSLLVGTFATYHDEHCLAVEVVDPAAPEQPINLSDAQVRELLASGQCEWRREADTAPYAVGAYLWGREAVYKPRQSETGYTYRADAEQPGRYPQKNYHMPRAACRLRVTVCSAEAENLGGLRIQCLTLRLVPDAVSA